MEVFFFFIIAGIAEALGEILIACLVAIPILLVSALAIFHTARTHHNASTYLKKLIASKSPVAGIRVKVKRGKLRGRLGTVVSEDGNTVILEDRAGRRAVVQVSDCYHVR